MSISNQIDYILCPRQQKHTLVDARSYAGTHVNSDHRLLVCRVRIKPYILFKQFKKFQQKTFNCYPLVNDQNALVKYQTTLKDNLHNQNMKLAITETAEEVLGYNTKHGKNRNHDNEIEKMSKQQNELRLQISNCKCVKTVRHLKTQRNKILHNISHQIKKNVERELDKKLHEINTIKNDARMFKAVNSLKRKKYENPYIHGTNGKNLTNPADIDNTIRQHFNNHFNDPNIQNLTPFERQPRKLNNKITTEEVTSNVKRLNNNRATGNDRISIENNASNIIKNLQKPGKPK